MQVNAQPVCPYDKWCGGCSLQRMPYQEQLEMKQKEVKKLLGKFGKIDEIRGMNYPYYYRNKVHAVFGGSLGGKIVCGTYEKNSHRIVNIGSCQIEDRKCDKIIEAVRDLLPSFKINPYNEDTGKGLLRHVLVRRGFTSNEIMVVLVTHSPVFPSKRNFVNKLREMFPEITTVVHNINDKDTSMILGDRNEVLNGKGFIRDTLMGCTFRISPASFYQVNPTQTKHLYQMAIDAAQLDGTEKVLDAYCGTGTIGIITARQMAQKTEGKLVGQVVGVELNPDAVRDARKNAKENGMKNISFLCDDAGQFMLAQAAAGEKYDVVFMDPPRSGSDPAFLTSVLRLAPKRVVYISCNPETQADDLESLKSAYRVEKIMPVDMFPFTNHVESIVSLVRTKK